MAGTVTKCPFSRGRMIAALHFLHDDDEVNVPEGVRLSDDWLFGRLDDPPPTEDLSVLVNDTLGSEPEAMGSMAHVSDSSLNKRVSKG